MILKRKLSWGPIIGEVKLPLLFTVLVSFASYWAYHRLELRGFSIQTAPLTILGAGLSIFLAFRNNAAYDRWWEARALWGGIVNRSRTLSRQVVSMFRSAEFETDPLARRIVFYQIAYAHALRTHLRKQDPISEIRNRVGDEIADEVRGSPNVPVALLLRIGELVERARREERCDSIQQSIIETNLVELTDLQGGCERIANTPLPPQYDTFPRVIVMFFCFLLPLGFVEAAGWKTVLVAPLVAMLFLVLEAIGRDIESPFGNTINDTPMTALSTTIEIELRHAIGDPNAPDPIQPTKGYLM